LKNVTGIAIIPKRVIKKERKKEHLRSRKIELYREGVLIIEMTNNIG
jgi:hypothetical protein